MTLSNVLLKTYSLTKRSGLLELSPVRRLFVAAYGLYKRHMEDPFATLIGRSPELFKRGHVIDVGANIGYTALLFSEAITAHYKVIAFEPETENFEQLDRVIRQRGLEGKVEPVLAAVGAERGDVRLWYNDDHHADHRVATTEFEKRGLPSDKVRVVPQWTIDEYLREHRCEQPIAFVKIDVQGYELPVLQGMENTVRRNPGMAIALEYSPSQMTELGFNPSDLVRWISDHRFRAYHLSIRKAPKQIDLANLRLQELRRGYLDLLLLPA